MGESVRVTARSRSTTCRQPARPAPPRKCSPHLREISVPWWVATDLVTGQFVLDGRVGSGGPSQDPAAGPAADSETVLRTTGRVTVARHGQEIHAVRGDICDVVQARWLTARLTATALVTSDTDSPFDESTTIPGTSSREGPPVRRDGWERRYFWRPCLRANPASSNTGCRPPDTADRLVADSCQATQAR